MPKRTRGRVPADAGDRLPPLAFRPLLLLILFILSGAAALIYEVVWFQMLPLVIGSSFVSLGTVLAAFMGGMGLGSLIAPRLVLALRPRSGRPERESRGARHPLRVYAALELGIGAYAVAVLWGLPLLATFYTGVGGGSLVLRAIVAGVCLVPPAMLMGATLPVVAKGIGPKDLGGPSSLVDSRPPRSLSGPPRSSFIGLLYAANLTGAVAGSLLAGFYLLRVYDVAVATGVAVALNVIAAGVAWTIARRPAAVTAPETVATADRSLAGSRLVLVAIAVSGFTALASEVIWTRQLALVFGATVYAFSLILAVFLAGLGAGSGLSALVLGVWARPRMVLGWCQLLLALAGVAAAYLLSQVFPHWPVEASVSPDLLVVSWVDIVKCALVVFPSAVLWGASFPLALAAAARPADDGARLVGRVAAANTFGAVAGALVANLIVASFGSHVAARSLVVLLVASALALLVPATARAASTASSRGLAVGGPIVVAVIAMLLLPRVLPISGTLVAYGRYAAEWAGLTRIVYVGEGLNASIAVSRATDGAVTYHSAGKVQASSLPEDMRLQRMLGHFSHLLPAQATDVLVIGFGAGVTAGALAISPAVERMVVAEIEPLVPRFVAPYFADYNERVVDSPKVTIRNDDARHFLFTTDRTFDVITSDMVDPWVKGTAALFTREFFDAARRRLKPGGVVTLFVQLYQSNVEAVKSELATFMDVFPNCAVWGNTLNGEGYDLVVTGQVEPMRIDIDALQRRLTSPAYAPVGRSLRDIGIGSAVDLLATYAGSAADLAPWLQGATINRDRHLRLQYLAGLGLNARAAAPIYAEMLRHAGFPGALISGSPESVQAVRDGIERVRHR